MNAETLIYRLLTKACSYKFLRQNAVTVSVSNGILPSVLTVPSWRDCSWFWMRHASFSYWFRDPLRRLLICLHVPITCWHLGLFPSLLLVPWRILRTLPNSGFWLFVICLCMFWLTWLRPFWLFLAWSKTELFWYLFLSSDQPFWLSHNFCWLLRHSD